MSFEDNFKSANNFTDKKNLVKGERELFLSEIKKYIQEYSERYKLFANLKLKELQKVTELISLCPKENHSNFMRYGIVEIIKSGREINIEECKKIIELISLCPEENRYNFMRYGITEIIKSGRKIEIEEWDKIIKLISLCPEKDRSIFIRYRITEIIKSGREINIEECNKIIKLISLCPEKDRYIFMRYGIAEIIKSGRKMEIEEWDKIIELISLCPEKDHSIFIRYVITEIIKSGREINIEECNKIIKLISLCPEKDRSIFMQYGIAEIIKSGREIEIEEWDKIIKLILLCPENDRSIFMQYGIAKIIKSGREIKIEEWDKIIKLILLCPENDRSIFMQYGIAEIIKSGREINIEECKKIIELISLCPEENRYYFMVYGIAEIIKSGREIKIEECKKIIELISLCPKENRSNFMVYGIAEIIKSGREINIEEWDKIIKLILLCPENDRSIFMQYGIAKIIKSGREIKIEEWDKIIELISLCPEENRYYFMVYGIAEIIKSGREINIEECKKIIELISLCPEKDRSIFMQYGITEIIKSGRDINIEECKKIIELISLCPEKDRSSFMRYGIAEIIKSGREITVEEWNIFNKYTLTSVNEYQILWNISKTFSFFFVLFDSTEIKQYEKYIKFFTEKKYRFNVAVETFEYIKDKQEYKDILIKAINDKLSPEKIFNLILIFNNIYKNKILLNQENTRLKSYIDNLLKPTNQLGNTEENIGIIERIQKSRLLNKKEKSGIETYIRNIPREKREDLKLNIEILLKIIKDTNILKVILEKQTQEIKYLFHKETNLHMGTNHNFFQNRDIDDINDIMRMIIGYKKAKPSEYDILIKNFQQILDTEDRYNTESNHNWLNKIFPDKKRQELYKGEYQKDILLEESEEESDRTEASSRSLGHFINESERILKNLNIELSDTYTSKSQEEKIKELQQIYQDIKSNKNITKKEEIADLQVQITGILTTLSSNAYKLPKELSLCFSNNPVDILTMGKVIGSCLNPNAVNFWSCFANTIDANKKVLFIKDKKGKIWGRVLMAVNEDKEIIRYEIYKKISFNNNLDHIINNYLKDFASDTGLKLGNKNSKNPNNLSGLKYYDDGKIDF